jgi:radical SAM superfamily enzyme YgiQ (UPF0313 family)
MAPPKICLVSIPTVTDFADPAQFESAGLRASAGDIPLGVLTLAADLEAAGVTPEIVDSNSWYLDYLDSDARLQGLSYSHYAAEHLAARDADLYGFSTICNSYPITIQTAARLKELRPSAVNLLGGPQASAVDAATLRDFPFVDFILRGEADRSLPEFVTRLKEGRAPESTPGATYRAGGEVRRGPQPELVADLDALPTPAFHLYPGMPPVVRSLPLELGRGCPFGCTFCSTNDFFRRRFRLKSPARVMQEMNLLQARYAVEYFDLQHDMFTVDRRRVAAFCEALLTSGRGYRWGCSARTDSLDEELIALMARAGCVSIFFGIESGSPRIQKIIEKRLDLEEARRIVHTTTRYGMRTAASSIVGFPEETMDDVRATVAFLAESLRDPEVVPQIHLLAPLAGTPLQAQYRDRLVLEDIYADMSHAGWSQGARERELIASHPEVFPNFYAIPTPHLDRRYLQELREFTLRCEGRFRWILAACHDRCGDILQLYDEWRAWSRDLVPHDLGPEVRHYYSTWTFDRHFVRFLRSRPAEARGAFECVLLEFEEALLAVLREQCCLRGPQNFEVLQSDMRLELETHVYILHLNSDPARVAELLRTHQPADDSIDRPSTVATRATGDEVQVVKLTPLAAQMLAMCDGSLTVDEVLDRFASACQPVGRLSSQDVAEYALQTLYQRKLIRAIPAEMDADDAPAPLVACSAA